MTYILRMFQCSFVVWKNYIIGVSIVNPTFSHRVKLVAFKKQFYIHYRYIDHGTVLIHFCNSWQPINKKKLVSQSNVTFITLAVNDLLHLRNNTPENCPTQIIVLETYFRVKGIILKRVRIPSLLVLTNNTVQLVIIFYPKQLNPSI